MRAIEKLKQAKELKERLDSYKKLKDNILNNQGKLGKINLINKRKKQAKELLDVKIEGCGKEIEDIFDSNAFYICGKSIIRYFAKNNDELFFCKTCKAQNEEANEIIGEIIK